MCGGEGGGGLVCEVVECRSEHLMELMASMAAVVSQGGKCESSSWVQPSRYQLIRGILGNSMVALDLTCSLK